MIDFMQAALWFFGGVLLHRMLSSFLELGQKAMLARELLHGCIKLAVHMIDDAKAARDLKYIQLEESGCDPGVIDYSKAVDDLAMKNWQQSFVNKMISTFPKQYSGLITFEDWKGAIETLDKKRKNRRISK